MEDQIGICGRSREVQEIHTFIDTRIKSKKSGVLYLTGPPGTGKSMTIQYVLDQIDNVIKFNLNCLRVQSSKHILSKLCHLTGSGEYVKSNENEILHRLAKKFTGRTCGTYVIVLDEMDQLPKSKNVDLIRTLFSWPNQPHSKLILVGIANTVNLTTRYQSMNSILGDDNNNFTRIVFRPYSFKDIKDILVWYLGNDENFEDANYDMKALDMIAKKFARENGDIRGALNALKSAIDDTNQKDCRPHEMSTMSDLPTPPSTPPLSPCKEKTNLASVANSVKKRQRNTHHVDDLFPFPHQIILCCIQKLCLKFNDSSIDTRVCQSLVSVALDRFGVGASGDEYRAMLDNLELQGLITFKRGRPNKKIVLKASELELTRLLQRKDIIMNLINNIA